MLGHWDLFYNSNTFHEDVVPVQILRWSWGTKRHCAFESQQLLCWWQFERWGSRSDVTFELSAGNAATPSEESGKCKAAERCLPSCRHYRFTLNLEGHWDTEATNWPQKTPKPLKSQIRNLSSVIVVYAILVHLDFIKLVFRLVLDPIAWLERETFYNTSAGPEVTKRII